MSLGLEIASLRMGAIRGEGGGGIYGGEGYRVSSR